MVETKRRRRDKFRREGKDSMTGRNAKQSVDIPGYKRKLAVG